MENDGSVTASRKRRESLSLQAIPPMPFDFYPQHEKTFPQDHISFFLNFSLLISFSIQLSKEISQFFPLRRGV